MSYRVFTNGDLGDLLQDPMLIAIGSKRGGVGKTITASNLVHALAHKGLKVIYIDGDLRNPNGHRKMHVDAGLDLDSTDRVILGEGPSLYDVVIGKKVLVERKRKRVKGKNEVESKYRWDRRHLSEAGIPSVTNNNVNYVFSDRPTEDLDKRGNKEERETAFAKGLLNILEKSKRLRDYHAIVVDFPQISLHDHIDAFVKYDKRLFVVSGEDLTSDNGIWDILDVMSNRRISGENNVLIYNKIPQEWKEADVKDYLDGTPLSRPFDWFRGEGGNRRQLVMRDFELKNEKINEMYSKELEFSHPIFLHFQEKIYDSGSSGVPYLVNRDNLDTVYGREINNLADHLIETRISKERENETE
jgi:MinD-like ATPase involved in chromosome partitioning or flagellar assembly